MASALPFVLVVVVVVVAAASSLTVADARVVPAEPLSVVMGPYGNPVLFLREKRAPIRSFPHRAMMFTGYYRPIRRSDGGNQATGVYAQGNSVSGGAYLGDLQPPYLKGGPEPIEEQEVSSAEAEAAPEPPQQESQGEQQFQVQDQGQAEDPQDQANYPVADPEPLPYTEPPALPTDSPAAATTETPQAPARPHHSKKGKKTPFPVVPIDDDEDDDDEEDEPIVPFVPVKGSRRRQGYIPNLNNFFPMMFSFPGATARDGSSGSIPGAVTAIANSYSTSKGGVASSVATAYGGPPNGKKPRRAPVAQE